ncbi:MAG: hypothetical protein ACRDTV_02110, partial [Mycobacterium sp.]
AQALGLPTILATAALQLWETVLRQEGPESDFTSVIKPMEAEAGVIVKSTLPLGKTTNHSCAVALS